MKPYTKTYLDFFGFGTEDFIPCEICQARAVDIHHIISRGMGGSKLEETNAIQNLMALCRLCHEAYGDRLAYLNLLIQIHTLHLENFEKLNPFRNEGRL